MTPKAALRHGVVSRPDIVYQVEDNIQIVEKPVPVLERLYAVGALRKAVLLVLLAFVWQIYAVHLDDPLLLPTFRDTMAALLQHIVDGSIQSHVWTSLKVLLQGYAIGLLLAGILTALASSTRIGSDLLETMTAMFNPLPAIALLPLALIWFGLGDASVVFILVHSVLWAVALNTQSGFQAVSPTLRMVGRNYRLSTFGYLTKILIPAAFPSILAGLKIGWAFAWRTLIAAELVFGVSSGSGGLGWFIYENKNLLEIPTVFAGLFTLILIGFMVENLVFRTVERHTVRKWGLQS